MFPNMDENMKFEVISGTDRKVSVMGKGRVDVLTKKGEQKFMPDVYYVPGLKCKLMSIGQLMKKGYVMYFF